MQKTWKADKVGHGRDAKGLGELGFTRLKVSKVQRIENLTQYADYAHSQQRLLNEAAEGKKQYHYMLYCGRISC